MDVVENASSCGDCGPLGNCSDKIECQWEEPVFGLVELVCVTVISIPLMLLGLLGNVLTILVVWLRPHMRSSTYFYLSSMAVSDMIILLLLPLDLYKLWRPRPWPLGGVACKLTMFLSECCTFCTVLHITFLSVERYLAICWPITAKTLITRHRTRALIGCLWLSAAVSAAPVLVMVGVEEVGTEERGMSRWSGQEGEFMMELGGGMDGIQWREEEMKGWEELDRVGEEEEEEEKKRDKTGEQREDEGGGRGGEEGGTDRRECRCTDYAVSSGLLSAMMVLSNLYFLVPLGILGVVYSLIGRTLWLRPQSSRRDQNHKQTMKMLGVIVLAFVLCWLPFHVGRTLFSLSQGSRADVNTHRQADNRTINRHVR
ncbi:growth hormone secretagogue receptor type 1-like [Genypterus blacodes]|uniref:growth hormone secretagogue receptor type 1-like n=1 Tax=Genypterus blacodes TaxID=154954 RepID=UPI003F7716E0